jgi:hypothetical protein
LGEKKDELYHCMKILNLINNKIDKNDKNDINTKYHVQFPWFELTEKNAKGKEQNPNIPLNPLKLNTHPDHK